MYKLLHDQLEKRNLAAVGNCTSLFADADGVIVQEVGSNSIAESCVDDEVGEILMGCVEGWHSAILVEDVAAQYYYNSHNIDLCNFNTKALD